MHVPPWNPTVSATREQFAKRLVASGLMTADELHVFWEALRPDERPTDGDAFARRLVRVGRLTEFQAGELAAGRNPAPDLTQAYGILGRFAPAMVQDQQARQKPVTIAN